MAKKRTTGSPSPATSETTAASEAPANSVDEPTEALDETPAAEAPAAEPVEASDDNPIAPPATDATEPFDAEEAADGRDDEADHDAADVTTSTHEDVPRSARRERVMLRVLWVFLALVAVGVLVAPLVVGVMQEREAEHDALGQAIARGMDRPVGAVASNECHGDGLVACWQVDRPVSQVADEVQWAIGEVLGPSVNDVGPGITCTQIPAGGPGVPDMPAGPMSCLVAARFGDSGVFVFVDPSYGMGRHGETGLVGSLISVTAP